MISFDEFHNVINNQWHSTAQIRNAINPSNNQPNPPVPLSSKHDLDAAVDAAKRAFKQWSQTTVDERKSMIRAYLCDLEANKDAFAELLSLEQGKPLSQAKAKSNGPKILSET